MKCPRCNSWLREIEPSAIFLRHFICDECWSCWRLESSLSKTCPLVQVLSFRPGCN